MRCTALGSNYMKIRTPHNTSHIRERCLIKHHRQLIHDGREVMAGYLAENYCPTLEEHAQDCPENLAGHYPDMVNAVVDRCVAFSLSIYCQDAHLQDCTQVHRWRGGRPPHVPIHGRLQACQDVRSIPELILVSLEFPCKHNDL